MDQAPLRQPCQFRQTIGFRVHALKRISPMLKLRVGYVLPPQRRPVEDDDVILKAHRIRGTGFSKSPYLFTN
jgi:hypothetical protein